MISESTNTIRLRQLASRLLPDLCKRKNPQVIVADLSLEGIDADTSRAAISLGAGLLAMAREMRTGKSFDVALNELKEEGYPATRELLLQARGQLNEDAPFDAVASNPGRVELQALWYVRRNLFSILMQAGPFVLPTAFGLWIAKYWMAVGLPIAGFCVAAFFRKQYRQWHTTRMKFRYGCVNPGVVVSLNPGLIAVLTDLRKNRDFPRWTVIKVLPVRLDPLVIPGLKVGARIGTAALYVDDRSTSPHWPDFYPEPLYDATNDSTEIAKVMKSISEDCWKELDFALNQVPNRTQPGLYRVQLPDTPARLVRYLKMDVTE